jgi:FkbM family methyltransferase
VWFLKSRDFRPTALRVRGQRLALSFPAAERYVLENELARIYFEDCYRLAKIHPRPATILDVGGNIGLFSIVARYWFPKAVIHCYEPNPALTPILHTHLDPLKVVIFGEAIGETSGSVQLTVGENSLHSRVNGSGSVPMVTLDTAVERCGGAVDLLKLDCEGCEWGILERAAGLDAVKELTMEFHLWARAGSAVEDLHAILVHRGFQVISLDKEPHKSWGLLHARR